MVMPWFPPVTDEAAEAMIAYQEEYMRNALNPVSQEDAAPVIAVMDEWFLAIESGVAESRVPDMTKHIPSEEEADRIIWEIDDLIDSEIVQSPSYFAAKGFNTKGMAMDMPADFSRVKGAARLAFAQEIKDILREVFDDR